MKLAEALELLRRVDWPQAAHKVAVFARELRGDGDEKIAADDTTARGNARRAKRAVEDFGRQAVGCRKEPGCTCPFCVEDNHP